jgi:hypothetical protein
MAVQRRVVYQVPVERPLIQPLGIDGVVSSVSREGGGRGTSWVLESPNLTPPPALS